MTRRTNPFVGLVPFTERDREWFFGREDEQRILSANLRVSRLTLVYGESGVGKSSVLLAGVAAALQRDVNANRRAGVEASKDGGGVATADRAPFAITVFREWRDAPLPRLAAAMQTSVQEASDARVDAWDGKEPLVETLRGWTAHARTLLVILDQFEEYFLYHPEEAGPGTFLDEFPQIVNDPDLRVNVLVSLREDSLARLDRFKGEIPELFDNYLRVEYLDHQSARKAIRGPVDHYNEQRDPDQPEVILEEALIETVLNDVRAGKLSIGERTTGAAVEGGGDRVETPYLQLVMERLWSAGGDLTVEALERLGGAEAIVSSHLNEAMELLSDQDREVAVAIFGFLVTASKTKIAQRVSDLAVWSKCDERDVQRVLDKLTRGERRILRLVPAPPEEDAADSYEIFHDVLAEAVLAWREARVVAADLLSEQRARRRTRRRWQGGIAFALLVVGLVVALILVLYSRHQASLDSKRAALVSREARAHDLASAALERIDTDPERSLSLARDALHTFQSGYSRDALITSLLASRLRSVFGAGPPHLCGEGCSLGAPAGRPLRQAPALGFGAQPDDLSPDGKTIAVVKDGRVSLWSPATGTSAPGVSAVRPIRALSGVRAVRFTPDGKSLLALTANSTAVMAPVSGGGARRLARYVTSVALSADRKYVATSGFVGTRVIRLADTKVVGRLRRRGSDLAFSPADAGLVVIDAGDALRFWRWREHRTVAREIERLSRFGRRGPATMALSPTGRLLATSGPDDRIRFWDVADQKKVGSTVSPGTSPDTLLFSPDGRRLLSSSGKLAFVTLTPGLNAPAVIAGHTDDITASAFSPDGSLVLTGSADGTARVWDALSGSELLALRGHRAPLTYVAFSRDGRSVLTAAEDGTARVWDASMGARVSEGPFGGLLAGAFARDGDSVYVTSFTGLRRWDPGAAPARLKTLVRFDGELDAIASSPRQDLVAAGGYAFGSRSGMLVKDLANGKVRRLPGALEFVNDVAFSPDGGRLAAVGDGSPRVWNVSDWTMVKLKPLKGSSWAVAWSPRGDDLAVMGADGILRLADARTGAVRQQVRIDRRGAAPAASAAPAAAAVPGAGAAAAVPVAAAPVGGSPHVIAFSPDGRTVAITRGRTVVLWDLGTRMLRTLAPQSRQVSALAFSTHGDWLVTGAVDRTVRLWEMPSRTDRGVVFTSGGAVTGLAFAPHGDNILAVNSVGSAELFPCLACRSLTELEPLLRDAAFRPR